MKPSFALDFRDGQIALLHRTSRGWQQVGATGLDAPDLGEALNYLRSTALGLSPRGVTTKLVIPNDQILYTQVHAPGPEVAKRKRQIRAALEGLTPYKVEDLVFDWWGNGPEVQVAVVPRETLAEAEAFAAEHRFNPVSFVAAPEDGRFAGEPFFGASALTATLLAAGEKVERDQDPISVMARDYPKAEPVVAPEVAPPAAKPEAAPEPEPVAQIPDLPEPAAPPPEPAAGPLAEPVAADPAPATAPAQDPAAVQPAAAEPEPEPVAEIEPEYDPLPDFRAARAPAAGVGAFDIKAMAVDLVDEAPMAEDVHDDAASVNDAAPAATEPQATMPARDAVTGAPATTQNEPSQNGPSQNAPTQNGPTQNGPALMAAFASRRLAGTDPEVEGPLEAAPADFAAAAAKAKKPPAVGPAPVQRPTVPRPAMAKPASLLPSAQRDTVPFPVKKAAAKFIPGKSGKLAITAPGIAVPRNDRNVVPMPKSAASGDETKAPRITAKGLTGLDGRPLPVRGKPRFLGLILTAILLVALAIVAAWSSFYLSSNETDPNAVPASNAVADTSATDPAVQTDTATADLAPTEALPSIEDEALSDGQGDQVATALGAPTVAGGDAIAEPPAAAVPVAEAAPAAEPAPTTSVVTNAAVAADPGNDPQDEIFLAAADTPPKTSDALELPQLAANSDPPPEAASPPPPFGTVYSFDAAGRIQPTPEGILTPEGVLLIAGKPVRVPPVRPATLATAASPVAPEAQTPVTEPEAVVADPALAGKKPRSRPAELVVSPETANQQGGVEAPELAPGPDSRFASVRPQKRAAALTQTAAVEPQVANGAAAASLAANGVQASVLAVAVSKKPAARPSGMDQAVEAAVAAAVRANAPQPEAQPELQAAALAPEAEAEPEVEAAAPSLPTNASVAKQATVKNALNLSRVSLLGIFGTSSGRYAMIRQAGGGIKKIKVGDTLDGGRVAAISATEVQYQKGNRMVTLSLPTG